jgi:hypothetical protein
VGAENHDTASDQRVSPTGDRGLGTHTVHDRARGGTSIACATSNCAATPITTEIG